MTLFFDKPITFETVKDFISTVENKIFDLMKSKLDVLKIVINLRSCGGDANAVNMANFYFDTNDYDFVINAVEKIKGMALFLFFTSNTRKVVSDGCVGQWQLLEKKTPTDNQGYNIAVNNNINNINRDIIDLMRMLEIDEALINKVANGEEVYVDKTELAREAEIATQLFCTSQTKYTKKMNNNDIKSHT